eukprot:COSAG02_NODE_4488_length_5300_cov_3.299366_3_plen_460_part_00
MVAFAGAGVSTAAGIADYASHELGKDSLSAANKTVEWMDLQPTFAHNALAALHSAGHLKSVLSQNHDGLFQKAGIPQACVNEIHGGWYDPSNPTVPMSGECRGDLSKWLLEMEQQADLVLVLGSSLAGMTAELLVTSCAKRASRGWDGALGSVICGFQRTRHDSVAALRFYCSCDTLLEALVQELEIAVPACHCTIPRTDPADDVFELPRYDASTGKRISDGASDTGCTLDLRSGAMIAVTGSSYHALDRGVVIGRDAQGHWDLVMLHKKVYGIVGVASATGSSWQQDLAMPTATTSGWADAQLAREPDLKRQRAKLGRWWVEQAMAGDVDVLPIVSIGNAASSATSVSSAEDEHEHEHESDSGPGPGLEPEPQAAQRGRSGPPKMYLRAYFWFAHEARPRIAADRPGLSHLEMAKELAAQFGQMAESEKQKYVDLEQQDRERYEAEKAEYDKEHSCSK